MLMILCIFLEKSKWYFINLQSFKTLKLLKGNVTQARGTFKLSLFKEVFYNQRFDCNFFQKIFLGFYILIDHVNDL